MKFSLFFGLSFDWNYLLKRLDLFLLLKNLLPACESCDMTGIWKAVSSRVNQALSLTLASLGSGTGVCLIFTPQHHLGSDASGLFRLICCCNPLSACCPRSRAALGWSSASDQWIKNSGRCVCRVQTPPPKLGKKTHRLSVDRLPLNAPSWLDQRLKLREDRSFWVHE